MADDRSAIRSAVESPFNAPNGSVEIVEAFNSSLAAIRLDFALSRAQCAMLTPENREIRQQENMMAAMLPLRFHSRSSALAELVALAVLVVVLAVLELVVVIELLDEVDLEVFDAELVDVEEVVDVADEVDEVVEEEVVSIVVVVELVLSEELVVVSELELSVVVDVVESEVSVVSRPRITARACASRASSKRMFSPRASAKFEFGTAVICDSRKVAEGAE